MGTGLASDGGGAWAKQLHQFVVRGCAADRCGGGSGRGGGGRGGGTFGYTGDTGKDGTLAKLLGLLGVVDAKAREQDLVLLTGVSALGSIIYVATTREVLSDLKLLCGLGVGDAASAHERPKAGVVQVVDVA